MIIKLLIIIGTITTAVGTILLWYSSPADHQPVIKILGNLQAVDKIIDNNYRMRLKQKIAITLIIFGTALQVLSTSFG